MFTLLQLKYDCTSLSAVADEDYMAVIPTTVIFDDHNDRMCFNITPLDNKYLESVESFFINITHYELLPSSSNIRLSTEVNVEPAFTEVFIEDDDSECCYSMFI